MYSATVNDYRPREINPKANLMKENNDAHKLNKKKNAARLRFAYHNLAILLKKMKKKTMYFYQHKNRKEKRTRL